MTQLQNNETMSSRQIAQIIGKPHSYILKSIRNMEYAWKKVNGGNFSLVEYKDGKGEMRPEYRLNKIECLYIATKFNNEARAKLVIRWAELEEKSRVEAVSDHGRIQQLERGGKHLATKSALKEKQRELMSYIRRYLKKGDIKRVSVETGIGYSSVQDVMGGMFRNDEVISALYQRALHNKRELLFDFDEMIDELKR